MLRFLFRARRVRERAEEMEAHRVMYEDDLVARGRSREAARREARLRFGNARVKLEEIDQMTRLPLLDTLSRDVRYALRVLRRSPAFALTALTTLAVVIGANTAVFSLAHSILFTPPPYPEPDRLAFVMAHVQDARGGRDQLAHDAVTWEAVRDEVASVDSAVYSGIVDGVNLVVGDQASFVEQQRVGAGYFRVLGVSPAFGREFTVEEDVPGGPAVAVLSHSVWEREFGRDPSILGRAIRLRGEPYQVVGVMPEAFGDEDADVWTPLRPSRDGEGGGTNFLVISRLRPDANWEQANQDFRRMSAEPLRARGIEPFEVQTGDEGAPRAAAQTAWLMARPMGDVLAEANREPIVMLGAATLSVLLIACVNIAALLLGRGASRSKEIATRMALGSGRRAVVRQLMVENLVLGLAGGILGVFVAIVGLSGLQYLGGATFQVWADATIDAPVLLVTAGLALATSTLFGLVPAFQASRLNPLRALADGGSRSVAGGSKRWPGRALVVAEVALGVALLVVTGLLVRTFVNLQSLDPGFDSADLVTASVSLQDARYQTAESIRQLIDGSLRELRANPAVESAGVSLQLPYTRLLNWGFKFPEAERGTLANMSYVSDDFFETYRVPVIEGRTIDSSDRSGSLPVVVVNETFARVHESDRPMIGRRVAISGTEREIVGVVRDVQQTDSGFSFEGRVEGPLMTTPTIYLPVSQTPSAFFNAVHTWFRPVWTVRPRARGQAAGAVAAAVMAVDPLLPVGAESTVDTTIARATAQERLMMTLVGILAGAALLLAAIGIHGLISHTVSARTREFAIRMALGASLWGTIGRIALSGLALAAVGAVLGGVLSLWGVGLVEGFLWSVGEHDPLTYAGVAVFFMLVALVASVLPALRMLRLDPAETLRN